ncbi:MAG: rod shape-determining protein [Acetatifactor sp.]|nr:rod shape-determining protein [Acetatifactor sp.]
MSLTKEGQGQLVFGLDIGTRSIVGTVGFMKDNKFHVIAQRAKEHETRAMLDGQIHDIIKVGSSIKAVKEQLEEDLNVELKDVCIAAAGRVLKTVTTHAETDFESDKEVEEIDINNLSSYAIERAYEQFQKENDTDLKFYCVGYTPMRYYMNGYQIGNLEGHKARQIGLDLIATFLPDDVVDGLYKAVELAELHVANLTLEPIAAIQVAIPEKFRMLNMALVDVGAGTSDVSITKDGTITAYGMIPVAGDSLTDILVQHCLVDFDTAEMIKRKSGVEDIIEYNDIMGLKQTISAKEVSELLQTEVESMTEKVAECIKDLNGDKPVSAVFVVGGGGTVPGYTESLAKKLGIVTERVAIRGEEVMGNIVFDMENAEKSSLMVTPIGICLSYYEQNNNFVIVDFNGERAKLYDNGHLTVTDAAMQLQFPNEDLFPKRGKALTFTVNGKSHMMRGSLGEAAIIKVNDEPADMYTQVHGGDIISVIPSTTGEDAKIEIGRIKEFTEQISIVVNGKKIVLPKTANVSGKLVNEYTSVLEGDNIEIHNYYTVKEVAEFLDLDITGDIFVNETKANLNTKVYEGFTLSFENDAVSVYAKENENNAEDKEPDKDPVKTGASVKNEGSVSGQGSNEIHEEKPAEKNDESAEESNTSSTDQVLNIPLSVTVNGKLYRLSGKPSYVFVDVFDYINFDLKNSQGRSIVTQLNGRSAEYMEKLKDGDVINIYWK